MEKKHDKNSFDLLQVIHAAEETQTFESLAPRHRFSVTVEPDTFTTEKYNLFKDYQVHVHHDDPADINETSFERFLCSSPLQRFSSTTDDGTERRYGSYHQCYRLDGRLIAMSVLDLLPRAVSAVYFVYHQDFERWSFGKISALREAALALEGGYEFYYMGFYIYDCPKMRYKGD